MLLKGEIQPGAASTAETTAAPSVVDSPPEKKEPAKKLPEKKAPSKSAELVAKRSVRTVGKRGGTRDARDARQEELKDSRIA